MCRLSPFCLIFHAPTDIFPSPPHMLSILLQGPGPIVPPSGSSHSTSSPQDRLFLWPPGSPSHGEHTWQHWLMSGTQPTGHLKHGHAPTSHLVVYSSGHTAPAQSCLKRNAAASRSSCIVAKGAPKSFNRLKSILNVTLHGIKKTALKCFSVAIFLQTSDALFQKRFELHKNGNSCSFWL